MTTRLVAWLVVAALVPVLRGCGSLIVTQQSVESLTERRGFDWARREYDGFVLFVEPGSAAAGNVATLATDTDDARQRVLDYLREPAYGPTLSIFIVGDRERMKDLIGRRTNGSGYYTSNAVCLVGTDRITHGATHELLHVIAMNLWGVPERWINEGAAVDATGSWLGHDVDAVCKHMRADDELPSLRDLTRRFDSLPSLVKYPASGSFVRYLRKTYGIDIVRSVWDGGRRVLPDVTGMDMDVLEAAWMEVVEQSDATGIEYSISPAE